MIGAEVVLSLQTIVSRKIKPGTKAVVTVGSFHAGTKHNVIPDDVKELALPVLRHRVLLRPEAEVEGYNADRVLQSILSAQIVPR